MAVLLGLLLAALAAGCLPEPATLPPLTSTPTVTITPTSTATIVWFPATATFTPAPTLFIAPTEDPRPAVGAVLLSDKFTGLAEWPTALSEAGSVGYGDGELTLAVSAARGTLFSLRKTPQLADFFLEIDAQPSLCRANDIYGLLLRASSDQDYYRLLVNCSGQLRLERVKAARATMLQDWTVSGQVPPGGMLRSRLGVWSAGNEIRVFVNGVFQFGVRDPTWSEGTLGVYARAAGETPLTVNFSNLIIYAVDAGRVPTRIPTPTVTIPPTATRRPTATAAP